MSKSKPVLSLSWSAKFSRSKRYEVSLDGEPIGTVESDDSGRNWSWDLLDDPSDSIMIRTGDAFLWNSRADAVDMLLEAFERRNG